jgi:histidinol phosphatase-like PHP family hydrolase
MTPLQIKHEIDHAEEYAKRNGFKLYIGHEIKILATGSPYHKDACIKTLLSFHDVIIYFEGYEQMKIEQEELNRVKK